MSKFNQKQFLLIGLILGTISSGMSSLADDSLESLHPITGDYGTFQKVSNLQIAEVDWLIEEEKSLEEDADIELPNLVIFNPQNQAQIEINQNANSEKANDRKSFEVNDLEDDQIVIDHFDYLDLIYELKQDPDMQASARALQDLLPRLPKQDDGSIRISDFDQSLSQNPQKIYRTWEFFQARQALVKSSRPINQPKLESLSGVYWDDPEVINSVGSGAIIGSTFTPTPEMHAPSHLNHSLHGTFTLGLYQINRTGHNLFLTNILKAPEDYPGESIIVKIHHYVSATTFKAPYRDLHEEAMQIVTEDPYRQGPAMYAADLAMDGFNQTGSDLITLKPGEIYLFPSIPQANREEIAFQAKFETLNDAPVQIASVYTVSNDKESILEQILHGKRIDLHSNPDAQAFERVAGIQLESSKTTIISNYRDSRGMPVLELVLPPGKESYASRIENHLRSARNNAVIGYPGTSSFDYGDYGNEKSITANLHNPTDKPKVFELYTYNMVSARHKVSRALRQSFQIQTFDQFGKQLDSKRLFVTQAPGLNENTVERLLYRGELPDFNDRAPLLTLTLLPGEHKSFKLSYINAANNFDQQYMVYRIRETNGLPIALGSDFAGKSSD
ncbi:MAG: DUF3370 family protein [Candidatus Caenarcaniphilales bacterium]|nr:DUF3370 family protein [Candidatus Caenarcaniphilales bacterium]